MGSWKHKNKMNRVKKTMIIAWAVHFALLGTLIIGTVAGNYLSKQLTYEVPTLNIEKSNQ